MAPSVHQIAPYRLSIEISSRLAGIRSVGSAEFHRVHTGFHGVDSDRRFVPASCTSANLPKRPGRSAVYLLCETPVRLEGGYHLVGASPTRAMVGWPGSWQAAQLSNRLDRSPATKSASGGRATRRAVMRMKPEQASKGKLWTPTRPKRGEGSTDRGSSRQMHLDRSTGVVGTARRDRGSRKRGRSTCDEGSDLNDAVRRRSVWKSDRIVVPLKPGNSGGGKDPDFWCAFEADEVG